MRPAIKKLLRKTRRKLFLARWVSSTFQFYFYALFIGTAGVLVDRIGAELNLWPLRTPNRIILFMMISTIGVGAVYGLILAWWDRRSTRELAWLIDRKCDTDSLLITALEDDEINIDSSWREMIEQKAQKLVTPLLTTSVIKIPRQGIRWFFLMALLIDLFLVVMLVPTKTQRVGTTVGGTTGQTAESRENRNERSNVENRKSEKRSNSSTSAPRPSPSGGNERDDAEQQPENTPGESNPPEEKSDSNPDLYGPEERHPHERQPETVEQESTGGPLREGYIRLFDRQNRRSSSSAANTGTSSSSEESKRTGTEGEDSKEKQEKSAMEVYNKYRRQAEVMIRSRQFSEEDQKVIRRYFDQIRPDRNGTGESSSSTEAKKKEQ